MRRAARSAAIACRHVLCVALLPGLVQRAGGDTTISGTVTVTDPATYFGGAGIVTMPSGTTLQIKPASQGTFAIGNAFVLSGGAGTVNLKCNNNDTIFNFTGPFSSTATAAQTLAITTGYAGNGDREEITFNNGIPDASGGSALSLAVAFSAQTASFDYVNLKGLNTFTGNITLSQGNASPQGYLTVGGRGYKLTNTTVGFTPGTGGLAPNYPGNVALGTATNFVYASSAAQNMTGGISGVGALRVAGSGALTLSGINTYTGNSTVDSGASLVLASGGGLKFSVTNSSANKVTGAGSATLNGTFTIDTSAVTNTSGSWTLVDTATRNFGASFGLTGFSPPVGNLYTKTAAGQTWTFNKSNGVLTLTSAAIITSFGIPGHAGVINQTNKTIALTVPYTPWGVSGLASLAPTFAVTSGTCNQTSGSPPSPTFAAANPVTYTVTDGATVNNYAVTVTVTPPSTACAMLGCDFGALGQAAITEATGTVVLTVPPNQPVTSLAPTFSLSANATISPASGSARDFTNPVVYRVTAENGTSYKDYTVSVQSYATWAYSGSLFIVTTPAGANLSAGASVSNFPLLVRFHSGNFNFAQAQSDGRDIRFTTPAGAALPYQIERWDAAGGKAAVWVRIPTISGNSTQEIIMYWGKSGVGSLSSGSGVFNSSNGHASVLHMGDTLTDEIGTTIPSNVNTTAANGLIGRARTFAAGNGVNCGTSITGLPTGAGPFSTGVWIRTATAPSNILGWGIQTGQGKVVMGLASPPRIDMDCFFGGGNVTGTAGIPSSEWTHVVHTYQSGSAKLYVNGALDATNTSGSMNIPTPGRFYLGGWYDTYNFVGDMDEVRISNVVRSADWVRLEYENQKPVQTLVGGIVPAGSGFSVSPASVTANENSGTTLTAQAGGARKVYWIYKKNGQQTLLATDQLAFDYNAGRVTGNDTAVIQFQAVFAGGTQTIDVPLTVLDTIPDPEFTLVPSTTQWDGRQTMTVTANISNLAAMQAAGFGTLNYRWSVSGVAVLKQSANGTLTLTRSQGSGPMTVTLAVDNGGTPVSNSVTVNVQEPAGDPWVQRTPGAAEKPVSGQFFARDPTTGFGTIHYNGTQTGTPDSVYLKVYKTPAGGAEILDATHRQALVGGAYAFSAPIAAGLITYRVVYGTTTGGVDAEVATVTDLVCGDAYIIQGQSNALAIDGKPDDLTTDTFVRTYGWTSNTWGLATRKGNDFLVGYWGMPLALHLKSTWNMPICIINGAVGGTRIDQHQANPSNHGSAGSSYSIYATLYNRVVNAKLTHGIRGVFWHQGENNSGAASPTGDWDYKSYQQYYIDMSAAWKQDFPNIRRYIIFQVQPKPCSMGPKGDQLREVQRTLPRVFSNMSILSTIGVTAALGHDGCHYSVAGYQRIADLVAPLVGRDFYGVVPPNSVTAPNLQRAYYTNASRNRIALEFDQPTSWNSFSTQHFYLDDVAANISSASDAGNVITLQLAGASTGSTIDYVQDQKSSWDNDGTKLIYGANSIAALTFADVAIGPPPPGGLSATGGNGRVSLAWSAASGATSYKIKRSTSSGGPYSTIATTPVPAFTDLAVVAGTPYFYVVSAVSTVGTSSSEGLDSTEAGATPLGGYAAWAADPALGLTAGVNDGPLLDPDFDALTNLLEFVLNSPPMTPSRAVLPTLRQDAGQWVFEYERNDESLPPATNQVVQYGVELSEWTDIAIPATGSGAVTITPGTPVDHVRVVIPNLGGRVFARLMVTR